MPVTRSQARAARAAPIAPIPRSTPAPQPSRQIQRKTAKKPPPDSASSVSALSGSSLFGKRKFAASQAAARGSLRPASSHVGYNHSTRIEGAVDPQLVGSSHSSDGHYSEHAGGTASGDPDDTALPDSQYFIDGIRADKKCYATNEMVEMCFKIQCAASRIKKRDALVETVEARLGIRTQSLVEMVRTDPAYREALDRGLPLREVARRWTPANRRQRDQYNNWLSTSQRLANLTGAQKNDVRLLRQLQHVFANLSQVMLKNHLDHPDFREYVDSTPNIQFTTTVRSEYSARQERPSAMGQAEPPDAVRGPLGAATSNLDLDDILGPRPPPSLGFQVRETAAMRFWDAKAELERATRELARRNDRLERHPDETHSQYARRHRNHVQLLAAAVKEASGAYSRAARSARRLYAVPSDALSSRFPLCYSERWAEEVQKEIDLSTAQLDPAFVEDWRAEVKRSEQDQVVEQDDVSQFGLDGLRSVAFGEAPTNFEGGRGSKKIKNAYILYDVRWEDQLKRWPYLWPELDGPPVGPPPPPRPDTPLVERKRKRSRDDVDGESSDDETVYFDAVSHLSAGSVGP